MKRCRSILLLVLFIILGSLSRAFAADQLKYLSKDDAIKAARLIKKQRKLYLFCGCCQGEKARKVRPENVEVYESEKSGLYEVRLTYTYAREGTPVTEVLDLAYTWGKRKGKYFTVASALGMQHDPCAATVRRKWE
jgi:hypothetical protein